MIMNEIAKATLATYFFELRMSLTGRRAITGLVLAAFPPILCLLIAKQVREPAVIGMVLTVLIMAVELFALLFWVPAGIYSELEGKNWIFSTSRPSGRTAMVIGKWLSGSTWAIMVGMVALSSAIVFLMPFVDLSGIFLSAVLAIVLGGFSYGAIFSLLGVVALKRAMGLCVAYFAIIEGFVSMLPAIVQKGTVFYHLRCIIYHTASHEKMGISRMDGDAIAALVGFNQLPLWGNFASIGLITLFFGGLAVLMINTRQLVTKQDD